MGKQDSTLLDIFIIQTIVYFDLFEYPLTVIELHTYLYSAGMDGGTYTLADIEAALEESTFLRERIDTQNGFYFLRGSAEGVWERLTRYRISYHKYERAMRGIRLLRFIPGIRAINVCNNLGYQNSRKESDIDLAIIASPQRMFTVRLLVTFILHLFRLRRHGKKITDRLCLSFYADERALNFNELVLMDRDISFIYWIATMYPLYTRGGYDRYVSENKWILRYLPNIRARVAGYRREVRDGMIHRAVVHIGDSILSSRVGSACERLVKMVQLYKMSLNTQSVAKENDTRVVISDVLLKFHENDRRDEVMRNFDSRLIEVMR